MSKERYTTPNTLASLDIKEDTKLSDFTDSLKAGFNLCCDYLSRSDRPKEERLAKLKKGGFIALDSLEELLQWVIEDKLNVLFTGQQSQKQQHPEQPKQKSYKKQNL